MSTTRSGRRLIVLHVLVVSLLLTLGGRLYYLQIHDGQRYAEAASNNRIREVVTAAPRGYVLDDRGVPLVANEVALVVSVSRTELMRQPDKGKALLGRVAKVLGKPAADLLARTKLCGEPGASPAPRCWAGSPYQPIPLAEDAGPRVALQILERQDEFPGVTAELTAVRNYPSPYWVNAAHLLGYVGPVSQDELDRREKASATTTGVATERQLRGTDLVGRAGLEKEYDDYLRGTSGVRSIAVDHAGGVSGTVSEVAPVSGGHLVTSIDARLQATVEQQLRAAITRARTEGDINKNGKKFKADSGAAVVMDVTTGRVLAMASYPTYDPSVWVGGITTKEYAAISGEKANFPMISRATQGQFAPASTFKVVSLPAAIQGGNYDIDGRYNCSSSFDIPGRTIKNYESQGYGFIGLERAINVSCDTIFYRWAYAMWLRDGGSEAKNPKDAFVKMAQDYGLGKKTGIDLPEESAGRIASREWKQRYWELTKKSNCAAAETGYPTLAKTDRERARYLTQLARENCLEGNRYRAGDAVNFAIGQGDTTVTPLQMARTYAAVANGGQLWVPQLAKAVLGPDGRVVKEFEPKKAGRLPVTAEVMAFMHKALQSTTEVGTGAGPFRRANFPIDQIPVGSKTGTGEVYGKQSTSWFASYAPANKPQYAVVMMVSQGGTGSGTSGPSVAQIYKKIFGVDGKGNIDKSKALFPDGTPPTALPKLPKLSPAAPEGTVESTSLALPRDAEPDGTLVIAGDVPDVRRREAGDR